MRGEGLERSEAASLITSMLSEGVTDAMIAAALIALAFKGETGEELAGMAEVMRDRAVRLRARREKFIDTAGTGSSPARTFNVSTAAAFVVAGAGLPVAKHGGRAASGRCGSADVLSELGVKVTVSAAVSEFCLNELGICFMFAPLYHSATARVAGIRREIALPTAFNLLGPLTNPAGAPFQIIGVWRERLVQPVAQALFALGIRKAWVVYGRDGLDEITVGEQTLVAETTGDGVREFEVEPEEFGLSRSPLTSLTCGDAATNARIVRDILDGSRRDVARDLVLINAAAALLVGGHASNLLEATELAKASIDQGRALAKLEDLVRITNEIDDPRTYTKRSS
jgi:anthranilate phosphoribosyltransferase